MNAQASTAATAPEELPRTSLMDPNTEFAYRPGTPRSRWIVRAVVIGLLVLTLAGMFAPVGQEMVGVFAILAMLTLIFLKVPVAVSLSVPGIVGLFALYGFRAAETVLLKLPYDSVSQWSLSVLPMFVLMGLLLTHSGLTVKIYRAAQQWLGWLPGGLAIGTNIAGAGLATVSGSTIATTHALARTGIPEMLRAGYNKRLAVGSVMAASLPGHLIPPSILMVIYAGIAQVPVGQQLVAGILPGALVVAMVSTMIFMLCLIQPGMVSKPDQVATVTWSERLQSAGAIWPVGLLILAVLGGMYSGVVTATEAGALGALVATLLTLWYRRKDGPFATFIQAAFEAGRSIGSIFLLLIGAYVLTRLLSVTGLAGGFADMIVDMNLGRVEFLLLMMVVYIVLGMFMDPLAIMLLTVPFLIPTLETMDISLLWFGVFVVLMAELAILTPPVGILSFIVHSIVQEKDVNQGVRISLGDVMWAVMWFLPLAMLVCVILIFFPEIVTFLPDRMG